MKCNTNLCTGCCKHVMTFKGLCCECGIDTTVEYTKQNLINLDWALGFCPNEHRGLRASSVKAVQELFIQDNHSLIQGGKLRIVLDLDETLIHTIRTMLPKPAVTPTPSYQQHHHHHHNHFHSVAFNAVTYDTIDEQHDTPMDVEEDLASMLEAHLESAACSIIEMPIRSLIEPPGFISSILRNKRQGPVSMWVSSNIGVLPTISRILEYTFIIASVTL